MSIQLLRGPSVSTDNPVLAEGQPYVDIESNPPKLKIGDGQTNLNSLPYIGAEFASDVYKNGGIHPSDTTFSIATADTPIFSLYSNQIHVDTIYSESQDSISLMNSILPADMVVNLGNASTRFNYIYGDSIDGTDVHCTRIHLRTGLLEYKGGSAGHVGSNLSIEKHELVDYDSLANSVLGSYTRSVVTASRVLVSDSSGKLSASSITTTQLSYLSGVTSDIQTQLNGKAPTSHTHSYLPVSGGTLNGPITFNSLNYPIIRTASTGNALQMTVGSGKDNGVVIDASWALRPAGNGNIGLGNGSHRWGQIYSTNSSISTSDRNKKHSISAITGKFAKDLVMGLNPVSYKFDEGTSNRTHHGFIAQDIEELLTTLNISTQDFAAYVKWQEIKDVFNEDGTYDTTPIPNTYSYGLRYEELIAPLVKVVQQQQHEIDTLKTQLESLISHNA